MRIEKGGSCKRYVTLDYDRMEKSYVDAGAVDDKGRVIGFIQRFIPAELSRTGEGGYHKFAGRRLPSKVVFASVQVCRDFQVYGPSPNGDFFTTRESAQEFCDAKVVRGIARYRKKFGSKG